MQKKKSEAMKALEENDLGTVYEYLSKTISRFKLSYGVIFENEELQNTFFDSAFLEIVNEYKSDPSFQGSLVSYYSTSIIDRLTSIIKKYGDDQLYDVMNRYIEKEITFSTDGSKENYIANLEKLDMFCVRLGIALPDMIIARLLNDNEKIYSIVDSYFKSIKVDDIVSSNKIDVSTGEVTSMLLELYCKKNLIEIDWNPKDDNRKKEVVTEYSDMSAASMYFKDIRKIPVLSPLEELKLFQEYHLGSIDARNKLIESNLRLVVKVARMLKHDGDDILDLVQYGNIALYEAIDRFNEYSGYKFSTYAEWWIKQGIDRNMEANFRGLSLPAYITENIRRYNKARKELESVLGSEAEAGEIAKYLNWPIEKVMEIQNTSNSIVSLDLKVNDEESSKLGDFVASDFTLEDDVIEDHSRNELIAKIHSVLDSLKLSPREKNVFLYRFGFVTGREETLRRVGDKYGISGETVRQTEIKVLKLLRKGRVAKELVPFLDDPENALANISHGNLINNEYNGRGKTQKKKIKKLENANSIQQNDCSSEDSNKEYDNIWGDVHVYIGKKFEHNVSKRKVDNVLSNEEKERYLKRSSDIDHDDISSNKRRQVKRRSVEENTFFSSDVSSCFSEGEQENYSYDDNVYDMYQDGEKIDEVDNSTIENYSLSLEKQLTKVSMDKKNQRTSILLEKQQEVTKNSKSMLINDDCGDIGGKKLKGHKLGPSKNKEKKSSISTTGNTKKKNELPDDIYEMFSKVPTNILGEIISSFSDIQQEIIEKHKNSKLNKKENNMYYAILQKVKRRLVVEWEKGTIGEEILKEYGIEVNRTKSENPNMKKRNLPLKQKYDKIDESIIDSIVSSFSKQHQDIIKKREVSKLSRAELTIYGSNIMPNFKKALGREAALGHIPDDLIKEYDIKVPTTKRLGLVNVVSFSSQSSEDKRNEIKSDNKANTNNFESSFLEKKASADLLNSKKEEVLNKTEQKQVENTAKDSTKVIFAKTDSSKKVSVNEDSIDNNKSESIYKFSLEEEYSTIDPKLLDVMISSLPEDLQKLVRKSEKDGLTNTESDQYCTVVMPKIKHMIAEEVFLGNLDKEVLEQYNIKPITELSKNLLRHEEKEQINSQSEILKARLLTIVKGGETKEHDDIEEIFYSLFDTSYLTDELNPKMFGYIVLRFGYLDGNNYSDRTIAKVLSDDDINACKKNMLLYLKYEIKSLKEEVSKKEYRKDMTNRNTTD